MELVISIGFPNGQFSAKCDTFAEADSVKAWLAGQGLIPAGQAQAPAPMVEPEKVAELVPMNEAPTPDELAHVAMEQAAQAEAAEAAAAKEAKKAAAAAKKAAATAKPAGSITDVTRAVTDYAAKFGPQEARALFARFGVNRGGDLKPEQFDDFIATALDYLARGVKASESDTSDLM
jgi:hypothetical protein